MKKTGIIGILVLNFFFFETALLGDSPKFVIGGRDAGFFSNFFGVLNNLHWCVKNNMTPVVYWAKNKVSIYYDPRGCNNIVSDNIWDYYFYSVSDLSYDLKDTVHYSPFPPDKFCVASHPNTSAPYPNKYWRNYMHNLINTFIKIKASTLNKIEEFHANNIAGHYTVGIHIRGTDKYLEVKPLPLDYIFEQANKHAPCQFFVATDEERILNLAKKKLQGKVIYYESFRVKKVPGVHYLDHYPAGFNRSYLGEEALIDSVLLSRCNLLIHTWSNLSIAALYFNPDVEHLHLDK